MATAWAAFPATIFDNNFDGSSNEPNEESKECHTQQIPFRQWIRAAQKFLEAPSVGSGNSFLASDDFLIPALKIARSLADQTCQLEKSSNIESGFDDLDSEEKKSPTSFPKHGTDWADRIVVHAASSGKISKDSGELSLDTDLEPLSFSQNHPQSDLTGFEELLGLITPDESLAEKDVLGEETLSDSSFLDVKRAEILPSSSDIDCEEAERNKLLHIYSLGLVYFELFSGGMAPPDLEETDPSENILFNPLTLEESQPVDLNSALSLLGGLGNADEVSVVTHENSEQPACTNRRSRRRRLHPEPKEKNSLASVQPLRDKGLPGPLCDLIANMIDCANGDFRGDESYSLMSDVLCDLQMMLDKPKQFLRELDVTTLSVTGLNIDKSLFFCRDNELTSLQNIYKRSISGDSELAMISGPSGVGKSMLANRLASFIKNEGGIFISGKFDQLHQAKPFSAISAAFNGYCEMQEGSVGANTLALKLKASLGQDVFILTKVVPSLSKIIGKSNELNHHSEQEECVDPQKRLQYLLCRFLEIISSDSDAPVTIFLDDLQWADPASVEVIKRILIMPQSSMQKKHFFFLGCCRGDEMSDDHPVWNAVSSARFLDVKATVIHLDCFSKETTNSIISELLCLPPRLTQPLSDIIYHKTKGNPLFFSQLVLSLSREGLLYLSLSRRRWEWRIEKIQSRKLPEDVAMFFTNTLGRLTKEVQSALCILSCFGASTDISLLEILEKEIDIHLIDQLDVAVSESLLVKSDGKFSFVHDRIQEAAYNLMEASERCLYHFNYGLALSSHALNDDGNESVLFTAVGQINRGGPSAVTDSERGIAMANLNLFAGTKAIGMSDFLSAFDFFKNGIAFLPEGHWGSQYSLTLQLFDNAARCSLVNANFGNLHLLTEQVLAHAISFEDKLNVLFLALCALGYAAKLSEAVQKGIDILSQLGENLPTSFSESEMNFHLERTKSMLHVVSFEDLLNYKQMTDPSKIMAMKFLSKLQLTMMMICPDIQPFVTLKMCQLSLIHGMSPLSPSGFAYYGSLLAKVGHIRQGYQFVKLAKSLLAKVGSKEVAGEVFVVSTHVLCYAEPLQTANEFFVEGKSIAVSAGDMSNALLNNYCYVSNVFWMGTKLQVAKEKFVDARRFMKQQNHLTFLTQMLCTERTISKLIGNSNDPTDSSQIDPSPTELAMLEKNPHQSMLYFFYKMYTNFIFRNYDDMKQCAEKYFASCLRSKTIIFVHSIQSFIGGLVSFWIYRQSNDTIWLQRGQNSLFAMNVWADSCSHNFENKLALLEAEELYCGRNFAAAKSAYDKAILKAKEHKFIHEEALACELASYMILDMGESSVSFEYVLMAHERYHEWGAIAKASLLYDNVSQSVSPSLSTTGSSPLLNTDSVLVCGNEQERNMPNDNRKRILQNMS